MNYLSHCVIGLQGTSLQAEECHFLKQHPPLGVILFSRNTIDAAQVRTLLDDVRKHAGNKIWASIDEEGGRINRLPFFPFNQRKTAASFGRAYQKEPQAALQAVYDDAYRVGNALKKLGFTHNCAPVLDVFYAHAHSIIGNRAYSDHVGDVIALATACMQGYHDAGIAAIGKHYPGHGRAVLDSHIACPMVDASEKALRHDAEVFYQLIKAGLNHIMTAHIRYPALDCNRASYSSFWLQKELPAHGFSGTIWSDDLCMKGAGDNIHDALQQATLAGCDALLVCDPEVVKVLY
ncbi:MAG: beta-N-acetylhexosaminidase [Mariprofundaceae bacterium]|nr:beta-N-acetylhexosaminidase [Mariprofundaceae bacterium]